MRSQTRVVWVPAGSPINFLPLRRRGFTNRPARTPRRAPMPLGRAIATSLNAQITHGRTSHRLHEHLHKKHRGAHVDAVEDLDLRAAEERGAAVRAAQYVREDPVPKLAVQVQIEPAADARRRGLHEHHRQGRLRPLRAKRDAERGSSGREGMLQRPQGARGAGERPYRVNSVRCSPFPRATAAVPPALTAGMQDCHYSLE